MINNVLTEAIGSKTPIICAPLGRGSSPSFMKAVRDAEAFPFLALMHIEEESVKTQLEECINTTGGPDKFGVNLTLIEDQHRRLDDALALGIRIFSLWYGDPAPYIEKIKKAGGTVFWTIGDPADAARARHLGVDFIVCQGSEAGGHLVGKAPLISLLPAIVDAADGVPVVAAGGLADGRGLAAALVLGAVGIWMGTRFVATKEAMNHPGYKSSIVDAKPNDLLETYLFDGGWTNSPHRVIRNSTVSDWENAGRPASGQRPGEGDEIGKYPDGTSFLRYTDASPWLSFEGDWEAGALYAGTSAVLIHDIKTVKEVVEEVMATAEQALSAAASSLDNQAI